MARTTRIQIEDGGKIHVFRESKAQRRSEASDAIGTPRKAGKIAAIKRALI